ncbi:hypothetical protein [Halorubrum kocurii]|nr:hypothetical protein [Halorubrum kocurii]
MALHNPSREASRLHREQLLLSVPMAVATVHQTPQLFLEILDPMISLVEADETAWRSNTTTADRWSKAFDNLSPSQ